VTPRRGDIPAHLSQFPDSVLRSTHSMRATHRPVEVLEAAEPEELPLQERERFKGGGGAVVLSVFPTECQFLARADVGHFKVAVHLADEAAEFKPRDEVVAKVGELLDSSRTIRGTEDVRGGLAHIDDVGLEFEKIDAFEE